MSTAIQRRRGTTAQHAGFTGAVAEITVDTTKKTAVVHDGATAGGFPLAKEADVVNKADAAAVAAALAEKADATATADALASKADATSTASALAKRVAYDAPQAPTLAEQGQARANIGAGLLAGMRNKIINGDGAVSQRTYTTVADDVYWCDRHYVLAQTAAITPTVLADVANGIPSMMRLTQSQAAAQRMGNAQILESAVSKRLRGKQVTLGGKLRCSSAQPIRFAVLEWTGTADAPTSDVIASWTSGVFTAGNFFLASNLTVAAVGTITPTANSITDWSLLATISGSCNNLIVLYWTEGTAAQNVTLDMAWGLVIGNASAETWPYDAQDPAIELVRCQRFCEKVRLSLRAYYQTVTSAASDQYTLSGDFKVKKRSASPTTTFLSQGTGSYAVTSINEDTIVVTKTGAFTIGLECDVLIDGEL